ncbi:coenzyme F420-0:L-glutamate ligase [Micromonospora sp. WMMD882]|uniref:coenzyme F420-0:L-glutamate ligase n=1 Tax=Micromonospora sp. WMMD882 TaxID=3015151 RepID=UPI00248B9001|nr:coenzyme F420-0:L-glutamate ligase [Micromonospora sp. WMMD882]WBB77382.1 coenzyme F420-0:L-glutamate ligase [Micromonospora sp. WMMD882]
MRLEILPVLGIGDVTAGDDLAALIATAAPWLRDGDVLVVTSKIVSKAEGRLVDVPADGPERVAARDAALTAETARVVATRGTTRIVQTRHGFVLASAGIDASNVEKTRLVLLPEDPDASARRLRAALRDRYAVDVAVIVSDTMGRPWRNGLTDVALGVAGLPAIRDHRGEIDPYGNELHVTQMAVVDELAGAGELIKGKCDQVPVAVVRGYLSGPGADDGPGARALVRDAAQDLFSLGTAEARVAGMLAAATLPDDPDALPEKVTDGTTAQPTDGPVSPPTDGTTGGTAGGSLTADPAAVRRALDVVAGVVAAGTVFTLVTDEESRAVMVAALPGWPARATGLILGQPPAPVGPADLVRFGADLHRLRTALAAHGVASTLLPPPPGSTASAALAI